MPIFQDIKAKKVEILLAYAGIAAISIIANSLSGKIVVMENLLILVYTAILLAGVLVFAVVSEKLIDLIKWSITIGVIYIKRKINGLIEEPINKNTKILNLEREVAALKKAQETSGAHPEIRNMNNITKEFKKEPPLAPPSDFAKAKSEILNDLKKGEIKTQKLEQFRVILNYKVIDLYDFSENELLWIHVLIDMLIHKNDLLQLISFYREKHGQSKMEILMKMFEELHKLKLMKGYTKEEVVPDPQVTDMHNYKIEICKQLVNRIEPIRER